MTTQTWLITGCSTGPGRALAEAVLARGDQVVVTARRPETVKDLVEAHPATALAAALDVTDERQRQAAVAAAVERFGRIDVLVNNAGHSYRAAVEEGTAEGISEVFGTNCFGPTALIRQVLPLLREQGHGMIVNISSIGVRAHNLGSGYYIATKAALEAISGSLRREVEPMGIRVMVVEPGAFRTNFLRGVTQPEQTLEAYAGTVGVRRTSDVARHGGQPGDPAKAAAAIVSAVLAPEPPRLLVLGSDAVRQFRDFATDQGGDVDAWEQVGLSTDFAV